MAIVATTPGFVDRVHDAQHTFRAVLEAMSRPGCVKSIDINLEPPKGLSMAAAAVCLTLLDLEVRVWLQPGFPQISQDWLMFHTGCRLTDNLEQADFALIWDVNHLPDLAKFNLGTPDYPEASTTLLMQVENLNRGMAVTLQGPGILEEITVSPQAPLAFWRQWRENHRLYPLGVDVVWLSGNQVLGLPRSVRVG